MVVAPRSGDLSRGLIVKRHMAEDPSRGGEPDLRLRKHFCQRTPPADVGLSVVGVPANGNGPIAVKLPSRPLSACRACALLGRPLNLEVDLPGDDDRGVLLPKRKDRHIGHLPVERLWRRQVPHPVDCHHANGVAQCEFERTRLIEEVLQILVNFQLFDLRIHFARIAVLADIVGQLGKERLSIRRQFHRGVKVVGLRRFRHLGDLAPRVQREGVEGDVFTVELLLGRLGLLLGNANKRFVESVDVRRIKSTGQARRVSKLEGSPCSTRWTVRTVIPASSASCSCDHPRAPRTSFTTSASSAGLITVGVSAVAFVWSARVAVILGFSERLV